VLLGLHHDEELEGRQPRSSVATVQAVSPSRAQHVLPSVAPISLGVRVSMDCSPVAALPRTNSTETGMP